MISFKKKRNFIKTLNLWIIITIVSIFASMIIIDIYLTRKEFIQNSEYVKKNHIENHKKYIKREIERVVEDIIYSKKLVKYHAIKELTKKIDDSLIIIDELYNNFEELEVNKKIIDLLNKLNLKECYSELFLIDINKNIIVGSDIIKNDKKILEKIKKNSNKDKILKFENGEYIFIGKLDKPHKIYICALLSKKELDKFLRKKLLSKISNIRFGKNGDGYIFVNSYSGIELVNITQKDLVGKNLWDLTDPYGVKVIQEERKAAAKPGGDFITYHWNKPSTGELTPKLSFVIGMDDWEWIIGTGVYLDDIQTNILREHNRLRKYLIEKLLFSTIVTLILLMIFLFFTNRLIKKLKKNFKLFIKRFDEATTLNDLIDDREVDFVEFEKIYKEFNKIFAKKIKYENDILREKELLAISEERIRNIIESSYNWIWEIDINYINRYASPQCEKVMGYKPEEIVGTSALAYMDDAEKKRLIPVFEKYKKNKNPIQGLLVDAIHKNGSKIKLEINGIPFFNKEKELLGYRGFFRDVTNTLKDKENMKRLNTAIEQLSEVVVITDIEGNVEYVNPAFEKITGYTCEEIIGKNPRILKSDKHGKTFYENLWNTILKGEVWSGHIINKKKDGTLFEVISTITPIQDENGNIRNFIAVKYDITEKVELKKQLEQATKLEAIGTLAGGIAHDFNNILGIIIGYGEMIKEDNENEKLIDEIETILQAAERAKELVKQILTFSRQTDIKKTYINPSLVVKEAMKMIKASLPSSIELVEKIDDCGMLYGDAGELHRVIINLCTNGFHAMKDSSGVLTIEMKKVTSIPLELKKKNNSKDEFLEISISDTGYGIEPAILEKIFDPFFTTKKRGQGTGMGLSISYGIIKEFGGTITVESEVGNGTTFHIYLPTVNKEDKNIDKNKKIEKFLGKNERILFIDDEKSLVQMGKMMLEKLGYKVTSLEDSELAIEIFRNNPENFDLIITDHSMPKKSGIELAEIILLIREDIPIILCSGYNEFDDKKIEAIGIKKVIHKPITKKELSKVIREVLDNK